MDRDGNLPLRVLIKMMLVITVFTGAFPFGNGDWPSSEMLTAWLGVNIGVFILLVLIFRGYADKFGRWICK
mgnify:FL=1